MNSSLSIPPWLALGAGALVASAVLDRQLMPSARWIVRSRTNRVLAMVSARLKFSARPFRQVMRQALIDLLIFDDKAQQAARAFADVRGRPRRVALDQMRHYACETVPAFSTYVYFRVGYWIGRTLPRMLYRVRIGSTDDAGLDAIPENATVVFVMNHRSNMDYIIASCLAAERAALSYAVGERVRVRRLRQLIRSKGAHFVRRMPERQIALATAAGVTRAVYADGGLTKDGCLREPRLGVLAYMLRGFHSDGERDLVFVPLGLNCDRVLEDRSQLLGVDPMQAPQRGRMHTLRFLGRHLGLVLRGHWRRFGYACVNFGTPVSVRAWSARRGRRFAAAVPCSRGRRAPDGTRRLVRAGVARGPGGERAAGGRSATPERTRDQGRRWRTRAATGVAGRICTCRAAIATSRPAPGFVCCSASSSKKTKVCTSRARARNRCYAIAPTRSPTRWSPSPHRPEARPPRKP
jgi:glycerol-3-phosphate O-acyltransferase